MKIEYVDAGELDVRTRDVDGNQRLWRIPSSYQPIVDGEAYTQIRIHRPIKDMGSKTQWVATCVYTGRSLTSFDRSFGTRDEAMQEAFRVIELATDMEALIRVLRIPDDETVYKVWYDSAGSWLKPQYEILHGETSAAAGERYAATLPSAMETRE